MPPVKLSDIVEYREMRNYMDDSRAWLDRRDGKIYLFPKEILGIAEESEPDDDFAGYPEWQRTEIREAIKFLERWDRDSLIELPDRYEIRDYDIMVEFSESRQSPHVSNLLLGVIQGRGAFRRFRDAITRLGLEQDWYAFRDSSVLEKVRRWCEDNEISYAEKEKAVQS